MSSGQGGSPPPGGLGFNNQQPAAPNPNLRQDNASNVPAQQYYNHVHHLAPELQSVVVELASAFIRQINNRTTGDTTSSTKEEAPVPHEVPVDLDPGIADVAQHQGAQPATPLQPNDSLVAPRHVAGGGQRRTVAGSEFTPINQNTTENVNFAASRAGSGRPPAPDRSARTGNSPSLADNLGKNEETELEQPRHRSRNQGPPARDRSGSIQSTDNAPSKGQTESGARRGRQNTQNTTQPRAYGTISELLGQAFSDGYTPAGLSLGMYDSHKTILKKIKDFRKSRKGSMLMANASIAAGIQYLRGHFEALMIQDGEIPDENTEDDQDDDPEEDDGDDGDGSLLSRTPAPEPPKSDAKNNKKRRVDHGEKGAPLPKTPKTEKGNKRKLSEAKPRTPGRWRRRSPDGFAQWHPEASPKTPLQTSANEHTNTSPLAVMTSPSNSHASSSARDNQLATVGEDEDHDHDQTQGPQGDMEVSIVQDPLPRTQREGTSGQSLGLGHPDGFSTNVPSRQRGSDAVPATHSSPRRPAQQRPSSDDGDIVISARNRNNPVAHAKRREQEEARRNPNYHVSSAVTRYRPSSSSRSRVRNENTEHPDDVFPGHSASHLRAAGSSTTQPSPNPTSGPGHVPEMRVYRPGDEQPSRPTAGSDHRSITGQKQTMDIQGERNSGKSKKRPHSEVEEDDEISNARHLKRQKGGNSDDEESDEELRERRRQ